LEQKTKETVSSALGNIFQNRKRLYEKILSLQGYEFGEAEEETRVGWIRGGVYIKTEKPAGVPPGKAVKPVGRQPLLRYPHEESLQWGLTGGIR
jgi:hypothetical protein